MQQLKLIFKGRLDFGARRSFDMVVRHWQMRQENYFKADILFKAEDILLEDELALVIPQQTIMSTEKFWRSTIALLNEVAQFAVAGNVGAWCVDNGKLLDSAMIEPQSDKSAVSEFIYGRNLVQEGRDYSEASAALSRAIGKYERHALAYERRGYVNYKLMNYNDALHDFDKSIAINSNNADPFYGRGKVKMVKNDWEGAAVDFDHAVKRSIALQPIYWLARLKKGECLFHAKRFEEAAAEFRLFLKRNFQSADPNFARRRRAHLLLGKALLALDKAEEAVQIFNDALAIRDGAEHASDQEGLVQRAIAKRRIGAPEFSKDLMTAAELGSTEAERLLQEWR